jgi:hypothetical protein
MDLVKIIGDLKAELQCLDAAIASMEELVRVQGLTDSAVPRAIEIAATPVPPAPGPGKRGRGRPRKNPLPPVEESPSPIEPGSQPASDDSAVSAA